MGCCQSLPDVEVPIPVLKLPVPAVPETIYPEVISSELKVLSSSCATKGHSGATYTRLVVGQDFVLAAVFDGLDGHRYRDGPAAQFCAYHCYEEYSRIASSSAGLKLEDVLAQTLRQLDLLYLQSTDVALQDRLECGCTAALLHLNLRTHVVTAAALGACAVVAGQRRGGLASATSTPLRLCGGTATGYVAVQQFLQCVRSTVAARKAAAAAARKSKKSAKSPASNPASNAAAAPAAPCYSDDPDAPQALGFGRAKGMDPEAAETATGGAVAGAAEAAQSPSGRVGLSVQTCRHTLGPMDECLLLLSGGAAAALSPGDGALLMHGFGKLSCLPSTGKPAALQCNGGGGGSVLLDSAKAGATAAGAQPAAGSFNPARLLQLEGQRNVARRAGGKGDGAAGSACVLALALDWVRPSRSADDATAAAAQSAALAAAAHEHRAAYHWQLLRLYGKYLARRRTGLVDRWFEVLGQLQAAAAKQARAKEVAAWQRLGKAVQVTNTGNVTELLPQSQHQLAQLQQAPHAEDAGQGPAGSTASPDGTASAAPPHGLGPEDVHLSEHPHAPERASPAHQRAFASVGGHGPTSVTPQRSTTSGGAAAPGRTPSSINRSAIPVPRVDVTPSPAASTPPYSKASSSRLPRPGSIAGASPTPATPAVASASATSPGSRIPPGSASPPGAGFSPSGGTGVSPPAAPAQDGRLSATHLNSGAAQIGMGHNVAGAAMAGGAGGGVAAAAERASRGGSHSSSSVAAAPSSNTGVPGSSSLGSSSGGGPDGRQRTNSSGGVAAAAPAAARGGAGHVPVAVRTDSEALMPPPGADPDPDLLSPDADQLAAWAMEAANALAAGPGAGAEAGEGGAKQLNDGPSGGGGGGGLLMSQANGVSALPRPDPSPKGGSRIPSLRPSGGGLSAGGVRPSGGGSGIPVPGASPQQPQAR